MLLKGKVSYPKRRKKREMNISGVPEPIRCSAYDIVKTNFQRVNRVTYLHRFIYIFEHSFKKEEQDDLMQLLSNSLSVVNDCAPLEKITGFSLIYAKYFTNLIEGNENSIYRHLNYILFDNEYKDHLGKGKVLIHITHIKKRFAEGWKHYNGRPSKLLSDIELESSFETCGRIVFNVIKKVYNMVLTYEDDNTEIDVSITLPEPELHDADSISTARSSRMTKGDFRVSNISLRTMQPIGLDPYRHILPENEILSFILSSRHTLDIQIYYGFFYTVPQIDAYKDKVWPVPSDFIPYDIFSKPYDCITELPRTDKKTETEKKEAEEEVIEDEEEEGH